MRDSDCFLELRLLLTLEVTLKVPWRLGVGPYGYRSVFAAQSGTFEFDGNSDYAGFRGRLEPGPADYCLRAPPDDSRWLTCAVRGVLQVEHPHRIAIYMHYSDCVPFSDQDADKLIRGGTIDFEASHFIVRPQFEVGDSDVDGNPLPPDLCRRLGRLNGTAVVAHGSLGPQSIDYRMYEIRNPDSPQP